MYHLFSISNCVQTKMPLASLGSNFVDNGVLVNLSRSHHAAESLVFNQKKYLFRLHFFLSFSCILALPGKVWLVD